MSGGLLRQATLREVARAGLPDAVLKPLAVVLERGLFSGSLADFLYLAGRDVGFEHEETVARCVPILLLYCAGNLTDDIVDGEDSYVEDQRLSAALECVLLSHAFGLLARGPVSREDIAAAMRNIAVATGHLATELCTTRWSAARYMDVGHAIAGLQFQALLRLLWGARHPNTDPIGNAVGVVIHVAEDIRSEDPRFTSMAGQDRARVLAWARVAAERLRAQGLRSLDAVVAQCDGMFTEVVPTPVDPG
ncbi:MAG: hypothetical protein V3V08_09040 [Nannocystaceae bacterium]